ncbi:hypothetical protein BC628DRAFT_822238 [Trametes gibbosa]|nr:hypothetical protein BC628DRAFT_822238 [Trametes gibbosa]
MLGPRTRTPVYYRTYCSARRIRIRAVVACGGVVARTGIPSSLPPSLPPVSLGRLFYIVHPPPRHHYRRPLLPTCRLPRAQSCVYLHRPHPRPTSSSRPRPRPRARGAIIELPTQSSVLRAPFPNLSLSLSLCLSPLSRTRALHALHGPRLFYRCTFGVYTLPAAESLSSSPFLKLWIVRVCACACARVRVLIVCGT